MAFPQLESFPFTSGSQQVTNPSQLYSDLIKEQQELNKLQMEREDSAYQRMVADMKKAGLNPWTGVSTGGSPTSALTSPKKSSLESLISMLMTNSKIIRSGNQDISDAIKTGLEVAIPLLTLLG